MTNSTLLYRILPENRIIIEFWSGEISIEDYKNFKLSILKNPDFNPHFNHIVDMRKSNFTIAEEDIDDLISFLKNTKNLLAKRKAVHLTVTPNQVVHSSLFKHKNHGLPISVQTVSTLEAAILFVDLQQKDISLIRLELEKLRMQEFVLNQKPGI